MKRNWLIVSAGIGLFAGLAAATVYFRRSILPERRVSRKLPVAKSLPTIPDNVGNYDIDGVSYDTNGVVISSDAQTAPAPV